MLRKRKILFVSILLFVFITFVNASLFEDNDSGDFLNGTFYRTFYNSSGFVQLNASQTSGNFSSRIFDAGINSTWNNISWTTELCYGCELSNNGILESGNFVSPLNMAGNVLLLHMNELSGNITDYSEYNNTGRATLFEGPEYGAQGKFNTSLDFETGTGSNGEFINFSNPSHLSNFGSHLTLEAWIRPESFPSDPTIIDKGPSLISFFVSSGAINVLTFILDTSSGTATTYSASTDMNANEWYHLVATYNGSQVRLYVDGALDGTPTARTGTVSTNNLDFVVGSGWSGTNPNGFPFDGLIDEVAVYNRSLSAQEIQDRYLRGISKLNLSVRSCDDASCSGESYSRINGTSSQSLNLNSNRYFQYKFDFSTEDVDYTPRLYNVSVDYLTTNSHPILNITHPRNNSNYSSLQTSINYTVFDVDLDSCWYSIDSGVINETIVCGENVTELSSGQGNNLWRVYANDSTGSESSSSVSFFVDSVGPTIDIVLPVNNSLLTNTTVFVNYTVFDFGVGLSRCWWTNSSGVVNNTITCGTNFSFVGNQGTNFVKIYANDTFGNLGSSTNTFVINTQAPSVNIFSPVAGSVIGSLNGLNLNFSAVDPALQSCWYTLTEGFSNFTIPGCQNTTFNVNSDGIYEVIVYANDSTGNVGFDSNIFTVSVDAPSINPTSPIDSYFGFSASQKIDFVYTPSDLDLQTCSLWTNSTGLYQLNQTNYTVISGQDNSFSLNMSNANEGSYSWAVQCNDTLGHNSITGNQTFYIDKTKPNVTVIEPNGIYASLTNIPISLTYTDASPVRCFYNVTFAATGNVVIGNPNPELVDCATTTFTLDTESSYFLWVSVNDSAGNTNTTRKSFTVDVPSSSGGGGGSSGGSGGSSGEGGGSVSLRQSFSAEPQEIDSLRIRRGESESIELPVKNNGLRFLNNCLFTANAGVSDWISGQDVYSLSPGETVDYIFSVNIPIDAEIGDYFVTLGVNCQEINSSFTYQIEVIGGEFELNILESERIGTKLKVSYSIENFALENKELNINYKFIDSDNEIASEGSFSSVSLLADERKEIESEFELPKNSIGDYILIIEASDGLDINQKQQAVRLTTGGISGFAISDNNLRTIAWFGIVVLLLSGMFIVIKIIRNQLAIRKASQQVERQFITIDLK